LHQRHHDRAVAAALRSDDGGVIGTNGASLRTLERARALGVAGILDYPITHHEFNARMLAEEARLVPEYASTMRGMDVGPAVRARFDAEIAAAEHVITLSSVQRRSFLEAGVPEEKLIAYHLGVDATLFSPRERVDDGVFRVLFTGQITQRKGISYLVEGFRRAAIPNSELVMVGRPNGSPEVWKRVPGVRHVPALARTDLPEAYASADVYVMPSLLEGCCMTLLEALAMGVASIATPNTSDVITDGEDGLVVPIRDADAIAERLRVLHADPELRGRLARAGRLTAERYDWREYGDGAARLFAELLGNRG
jgi:glycosyltransferase involved in cell wall biosynthesis